VDCWSFFFVCVKNPLANKLNAPNGELNSKHGQTVALALRDLSIALARLANTLDKASQN
jgi:hypothetical protein